MPDLSGIARLERLISKLALVVGLAVALIFPVTFGLVSYFAEAKHLNLQAGLLGNSLSQYAYVHGATWRYSKNRLADIVSLTIIPTDDLEVRAMDATGKVIFISGPEITGGKFARTDQIRSGSEVVGSVEVAISLWPFVVRLLLAFGIGATLGLAAYCCAHFLPLRVLRRALTELARTQEDLQEQVKITQAALDQTQKQSEIAARALEELKVVAREAQNANSAKSDFLANMSHELRTPLNAIIGFSELIQMEFFGPIGGKYKEYSADIHSSGKHLLNIVNDILDITKAEAGALEMDREVVDLAALMEQVHRMAKLQAEKSGISLVMDVKSTAVSVRADTKRLIQGVLNLVANGIKFTPPGGTVSVRAGADDVNGTAWITVVDTGIGIAEEHLEKALAPFGQVDSSLARKHEGTGLGLPLTKKFVEAMGGTFSLQSEVGKGTRITLHLPLERTSQVEETRNREAAATGAIALQV
jgi:signal transduction histidine kinase